MRDLHKIFRSLATAGAHQRNRSHGDALVDNRDAIIAFDGLACGDQVFGIRGDFTVDIVAGLLNGIRRTVEQRNTHRDGANVELFLLDHLIGLVDLHDIQHGIPLSPFLLRPGSDAVHLGKDLLALAADAHANLLAELVEIVHNLAEFLVGLGIIHDHHHVEETVDDGLGNVKHVDLMFGKVCADACDDADSILADDGDDCLVHGAP